MFQMTALKAITLGAALSAAALFGSAASATTVDLSLGGDATGDFQSTGSFSSGDISGTITAGCGDAGFDTNCDHVGVASNPTIHLGALGAGVNSFQDVSGQLDTANSGEYLTFTFDEAVTLLNIDFGAFSGDEAYNLYVNGVLVAGGSSSDPWTTDFYNVTSFTIAASDMDDCFDRGFTVKSFEVELAPVPLPAGGLMLVAGLGGLGLIRRRRKA